MSLPVATFAKKQSAMFHSWCTRKEQTPLCWALSLGLENPLKMLKGFNISQQKVLLEKGKEEWGKLFPVSFLLSANQACYSGECFSFFLFFFFAAIFIRKSCCSVISKAVFPSRLGRELLNLRQLFVSNIFYCDYFGKCKKAERRKLKLSIFPALREISRLLLLSYTYYLLLSYMLMKIGNMSCTAFSFHKYSYLRNFVFLL